MINNKKAFSFVELIISISIVVLLSVIAYTAYNSNNQKTNNSKTLASITTIKNALSNYLEEKSSLPDPNGNKNYFKQDSSYAHHTGDNAFGVYGSVTQKTLPKKYLDTTPLDPVSNHYFSYGKTLDNKYFEIAGVLRQNDKAQTKLDGTYPGEYGPISLIREYNGPHFLVDDSQTHLPYNPDEHILIVTDNNKKIYRVGDTISTTSSETKTLYFSDGSISELKPNSSITISKSDFKNPENNLLTTVKLFLSSGEIFTKATALNENSDFEIYTSDTTAAVRGTIFSVKYDSTNKTTIAVLKGKVEVQTQNNTKEITNNTQGNSRNNFSQTKSIDDTTKTNLEIFANIILKENLPQKTNTVQPETNYCPKYEESESYTGDSNCTCKNTQSEFTINGNKYCEDKLDGKELYAFAPYKKSFEQCLNVIKDENTQANNNAFDNKLFKIYIYNNIIKNGISNFGYQNPSWNEWTKFCTMYNTLMIDNVGREDYLKYTGLNLGNNFAIEMSVLGSDLMRTSGKYNLFNTNETTYLKITDTYNCSGLNNNEFYRVIAKINQDNINVKVLDKYGNEAGNCNFSSGAESGNTELYIGSNNAIHSQWNGIIDYVKIYK